MNDPVIAKFLQGLKEHLKDNQEEFHEHHSWCGDTEGGFYDTDEFDFDKLLAEIDKFSATFASAVPGEGLTDKGEK